MLKITDLNTSKKLESKEMADVRGGFDPFSFVSSNSIKNKVADVSQVFELALAQGNSGSVTNNQTIAGGNGFTLAPVDQYQDQYNNLSLSGIGNISVS